MTRTLKVTCDRCGEDISTVSDYRGRITVQMTDYRDEPQHHLGFILADLCRPCFQSVLPNVDAALALPLEPDR